MIRSFVVLLLLAVFFLTGMVMGIDREHNDQGVIPNELNKSSDLVMEEKKQTADDHIMIMEQQKETVSAMNIENPNHFTQKMASFFEVLVKGFYEIVVQVIYQFVQLFY